MNKYNKDDKCPKCGNSDINDSFREAGERIDQCIGDPLRETSVEIIRRYCRNCRYRWSTRPLDAK